MKTGDWVIRKDGKHWCSLIPDYNKWKLVRVAVGPLEYIPQDICWHFAIKEGTRVGRSKVWLSFGYFPSEEPISEWRVATDTEIAEHIETLNIDGPFIWE